MTGFGKATCSLDSKTITIEIRALNSKQTDINCKFPPVYRIKEIEVRNELINKLTRGKIDVSLSFEQSDNESNTVINPNVVKSYFNQLKQIAKELELDLTESLLQSVIRLPEAITQEKMDVDDKEWTEIMNCLSLAVEKCDDYRKIEGKRLEDDILIRIKSILDLLKEISPFELKRLENIKHRIKDNLSDLFDSGEYDKNRFEQEMIYYLEKYDITEEKVRLKSHCEYFKETSALGVPVGKKLGFIVQEMGREINTIGSKANDHDIQKIVVKMKDELEKIKEQLMNIL